MLEETYKFIWKSFKDELPDSNRLCLVRPAKDSINQAQWAFIDDDKKKIRSWCSHWEKSLSECKAWLWCAPSPVGIKKLS